MRWIFMSFMWIYFSCGTIVFSEEIIFYGKKRVDLRGQLPEYLEDSRIGKENIGGRKYYYKIYKDRGGKVLKEEHYIDGDLVNYYRYEYDGGGNHLSEEFYDNEVLIQKRLFFYHSNGNLKKIESRGSGGGRYGDIIYFDERGEKKRLARYRNNKLSFVKRFGGGFLEESQQYTSGSVEITRYEKGGEVLYEESVKKERFRDVEELGGDDNLLSWGVEEIKKLILIKKGKDGEGLEKKMVWLMKDIKKVLGEGLELRVAKRLKVRDLNPERYGLLDWGRHIEIWLKEGRKVRIFIGNFNIKEGGYFVVMDIWGKEIFLVDKEGIDFLFKIKKD